MVGYPAFLSSRFTDLTQMVGYPAFLSSRFTDLAQMVGYPAMLVADIIPFTAQRVKQYYFSVFCFNATTNMVIVLTLYLNMHIII